jgi:all-trans-8'-apo-beta-carotenal 15,15'-oxygenase
MAQTDPLARDIHRPLKWEELQRGWNNLEEECEYWIPPVNIIGKIPPELNGTLLRNGPGLNEIYGKKVLHPIDGDGMIVALTFLNGRVHLKTKFVKTKHRIEETEAGKYLYRGTFGTNPQGALKDTSTFLANALRLRLPQLSYRNPSNTNVFYWGGKVISCYETGTPYCLDPHTLTTVGPEDFNGRLQLGCLAAHFRIDVKKNVLVCLSIRPGVGRPPSLVLYEFDPHWKLLAEQTHHIEGLNYAHDFLLLKDYYILHMTPFVDVSSIISAIGIYTGWSTVGGQMKYYPHLPSRFVVIPRHSGAKYQAIMYFDTEPFHIFHFGTAEQTGDEISFTAVCLGKGFDMTFSHKVWLSNADVAPGRMYSFRLKLAERTCKGEQVDRASVEFPTVHPYRHGEKGGRFSYLMASDRNNQNLPYRDVVKFDVLGKDRQVWYSHGCLGEPVFVPRLGWKGATRGKEDDGYVIVQLYVPERHITEFVVLDARSLTKGPLARIVLRHHIPFGFHGTFTPKVFITEPPKILLSKL